MKGVESKLDYLEKNKRKLHSSDAVSGYAERRSDGGYAVADSVKYRKIWERWMIWRHLPVPATKKASAVYGFVMNYFGRP